MRYLGEKAGVHQFALIFNQYNVGVYIFKPPYTYVISAEYFNNDMLSKEVTRIGEGTLFSLMLADAQAGALKPYVFKGGTGRWVGDDYTVAITAPE